MRYIIENATPILIGIVIGMMSIITMNTADSVITKIALIKLK